MGEAGSDLDAGEGAGDAHFAVGEVAGVAAGDFFVTRAVAAGDAFDVGFFFVSVEAENWGVAPRTGVLAFGVRDVVELDGVAEGGRDEDVVDAAG